MADEPTTPTDETPKPEGDKPPEDQTVPYDRFQQVNKQAKDAKDQAKALQKQLDDLKAQMDEREQAGLPELDRIKKAAEAAEKRAAEAETRAEQAEKERELTRRERWVTAAATEQNFIDAGDATRYVDLDAIEDADQAARAVKAVAKKKQHLIKSEEPRLPGRVLANGQPATAAAKKGAIDPEAEAEGLAASLEKFLKSRA